MSAKDESGRPKKPASQKPVYVQTPPDVIMQRRRDKREK